MCCSFRHAREGSGDVVHTEEKSCKCPMCAANSNICVKDKPSGSGCEVPVRSKSSTHPLDPELDNMRLHARKKLHKCKGCTKSFKCSYDLKMHMITHIDEKPHKCIVCTRSFKWSSSLKTHMRTHSGEKPYTCSACFRSFAKAYHLSRHMLLHTGEKPFKCPLCIRAFCQKSDLNKHERRVHNGGTHPLLS
jgi:uncharacterized Zn-finger protein